MITRVLVFISLCSILACSHKSAEQVDKTNVSDDRSFKKFYYSKQFATRFVVKAGEQVLDWQGMIAVAIESKDTESGSSCNAKLYLGNDISFDYPQPDNFINITGERHDEMFSFAHDVSDGDARMHAQIIFSAANKIMVRGYKGEEVSASTGFNIDYVMKDAANGITYIKTDDTLCDVLFNEEYKYYLLLKPKGVDKSADFLKFSLPTIPS